MTNSFETTVAYSSNKSVMIEMQIPASVDINTIMMIENDGWTLINNGYKDANGVDCFIYHKRFSL